MKKYVPLLLAPLMIFLTLFGTAGQASAAVVGGPSLSTMVYAEIGEFINFYTSSNVRSVTPQQFWTKADTFLKASSPTGYTYYHVFCRRQYYSGADLTGGEDTHFFMRVNTSLYPGAAPIRESGKVYFAKPDGTKVDYEYMVNEDYSFIPYWTKLKAADFQGVVLYQTATIADITMFESFSLTQKYDPNKPPAYAYPDNKSPSDGTGYKDPNAPDSDFPKQPEPPDSNWDLIGWIRYLVEWVIYLVKTFVYLISQLSLQIAAVASGSASIVKVFGDFFAFLPPSILGLFTMGILSLIIVGVVRK